MVVLGDRETIRVRKGREGEGKKEAEDGKYLEFVLARFCGGRRVEEVDG